MTALSTAKPETARERPLTLGAVTVTLILWASAFVVIRYADRYLSPGPLALARMLVGSFILGVLMVARRQRLPAGSALGYAVLAGILWFGLYNVALNAGERRIDAGTASLLVNTGPIFVALLAGALLREGFPRALFVGCLVSFAGAALIAIAVSGGGGRELWGAVLCVVAALGYAGAMVAQKPALRRSGALPITWVGCTTAAIALLPYLPELARQLGHAPGSAIGWTVYLGLGPTATAFVFWAFALARTEAGRLGVTTYLVPPLVVLLGWLALDEVPPLLALPGGLLCLAGVALARRR